MACSINRGRTIAENYYKNITILMLYNKLTKTYNTRTRAVFSFDFSRIQCKNWLTLST